MNRLTAQLAFLFLFSFDAFGSIVVVQFGPDKIVAAADSRVNNGSTFKDGFCKIIEIEPRTFFFATGDAVIFSNPATKEEIFSSYSVAVDAYKNYADLRGYGFVRLVGTFAEMLREKYQSLSPKTFEGLPNGKVVSENVFVRSDEKGGRLYWVSLKYTLPPEVLEPGFVWITREARANEKIPTLKTGDENARALVDEFFANETPRAKVANDKFRQRFKDPKAKDYDARKLQGAIEAAIDWIIDKKMIGGQVDTLSLERGGTIKWISQKDCSKPKIRSRQ